MQLPTNMKVGKNWYRIWYEQAKRPGHHGCVNYTIRTIKVYDRDSKGKPYKPAEVRDTFWHELTHAILYEMGDDLHRNEKFVRQFATLLSKSIDSARFDDE